jgi:hypothetical protein
MSYAALRQGIVRVLLKASMTRGGLCPGENMRSFNPLAVAFAVDTVISVKCERHGWPRRKKKPPRCVASGMRGERYRIRPRHAGATQHRVGGAGAGGVVRVASTGGD